MVSNSLFNPAFPAEQRGINVLGRIGGRVNGLTLPLRRGEGFGVEGFRAFILRVSGLEFRGLGVRSLRV